MAFKWISLDCFLSASYQLQLIFVFFVNNRWRHILFLSSLAIYFLYYMTLYYRCPLLNTSYIVTYLH